MYVYLIKIGTAMKHECVRPSWKHNVDTKNQAPPCCHYLRFIIPFSKLWQCDTHMLFLSTVVLIDRNVHNACHSHEGLYIYINKYHLTSIFVLFALRILWRIGKTELQQYSLRAWHFHTRYIACGHAAKTATKQPVRQRLHSNLDQPIRFIVSATKQKNGAYLAKEHTSRWFRNWFIMIKVLGCMSSPYVWEY